MIKILADMNISPQTVSGLLRAGWDVVRVSDPLAPTAPDDQVLSLARAQDRVILTQDLDYSALLALGGHQRPSLITVRLRQADPDGVLKRVLEVLPSIEGDLARGAAVTVEEAHVRIRRLPVL